jgi:hypothetical protein
MPIAGNPAAPLYVAGPKRRSLAWSRFVSAHLVSSALVPALFMHLSVTLFDKQPRLYCPDCYRFSV